MTALIVVIGCIVSYLVIGALYARSRVLDCYTRKLDENRRNYSLTGRTLHKYARDESAPMVVWRFLFWPYAIPFDLIRGPAVEWFTAPVTNRQAQAQQLRDDAASWRSKQHDGTPAEREMASELARMCEDRAREVDL